MGTLVWLDDFESYTANAAITAPWVNNGNCPVSTAQAHGGTRSLAAGSNGGNSNCYRPIGSNLPQWYADFWMYTVNVASGGGNGQYVSFTADSTNAGTAAFVNVSSTGAGRVGGQAQWFTFAVSTGAWHHYLFEVTTALAGTAKLTVDGTVAGTFSGDTRDGIHLSSFVSHVWVFATVIGPSPPADFYVDDLGIYSGVVAPVGGAQARAMVLA